MDAQHSSNQSCLPRIAVLLSGSGRTLENLVGQIDEGRLHARVVRVISTRENVRGVSVAQAASIPALVIKPRGFETLEAFSDALFNVLRTEDPELVVCAGFLSRIRIPDDFDGKIVNIHPSLLPLFGGKGYYGPKVHQAVLDSGMKVTGCTVHFVNNEYDAGPIIAQRCVPVREDDTVDSLAKRVFKAELELYPATIEAVLRGQVKMEHHQVRISPEAGLP